MLEKAAIIAPINNSILYSKEPRILFKTNNIDSEFVIPYITLKNESGIFTFTSTRNPDMFNTVSIKGNSSIVFIPKNIIEGENEISIRLYDGKYFSEENVITYIYKIPTISIVHSNTIRITSSLYKELLTMTNNTLKAYDKDLLEISTPISNKSKIYKNYFSEINNKLYDLTNWINENYSGLNRYREKKIINIGLIKSSMLNDLLLYITHP